MKKGILIAVLCLSFGSVAFAATTAEIQGACGTAPARPSGAVQQNDGDAIFNWTTAMKAYNKCFSAYSSAHPTVTPAPASITAPASKPVESPTSTPTAVPAPASVPVKNSMPAPASAQTPADSTFEAPASTVEMTQVPTSELTDVVSESDKSLHNSAWALIISITSLLFAGWTMLYSMFRR